MSIEWTGQNGSAALGWNGLQWIQQGQTFSLADSWILRCAEFQLDVDFGTPERFVATLWDGSNLSIALASTAGYSASSTHPGWELFDFGSVVLGPGSYALTLAATESFPVASAGFGFDTAGAAPGNRIAWVNNQWISHSGDSMFSLTFAPIPEPLSSGLFLAGGALLLARRKRSRSPS